MVVSLDEEALNSKPSSLNLPFQGIPLLWLWALGFRVQRFRVSGFGVQDSAFRVLGLGFQGLGFSAQPPCISQIIGPRGQDGYGLCWEMTKNPTLNPKTLNPKTLNPKTLNPKTLNPKTLNPKTLNPKPDASLFCLRLFFQMLLSSGPPRTETSQMSRSLNFLKGVGAIGVLKGSLSRGILGV